MLETLYNCDVTEIVPVTSSNPLIAEAVLLKNDQHHILILINFTDRNETIVIDDKLKNHESMVFDQRALPEFENSGALPSLLSENNLQHVVNNTLSVPAHSIMFLAGHMTSSLNSTSSQH